MQPLNSRGRVNMRGPLICKSKTQDKYTLGLQKTHCQVDSSRPSSLLATVSCFTPRFIATPRSLWLSSLIGYSLTVRIPSYRWSNYWIVAEMGTPDIVCKARVLWILLV